MPEDCLRTRQATAHGWQRELAALMRAEPRTSGSRPRRPISANACPVASLVPLPRARSNGRRRAGRTCSHTATRQRVIAQDVHFQVRILQDCLEYIRDRQQTYEMIVLHYEKMPDAIYLHHLARGHHGIVRCAGNELSRHQIADQQTVDLRALL